MATSSPSGSGSLDADPAQAGGQVAVVGFDGIGHGPHQQRPEVDDEVDTRQHQGRLLGERRGDLQGVGRAGGLGAAVEHRQHAEHHAGR